jgi:lipoprotein-anchoring transpeptidase ErfK/SrfK
VTATELPNGQLAWVNRKNSALHVRRTAYSLHADLSGRWLELRKHGRRIRRITVAVGRPGSETPTGRFAVTDKLNGRSFGSYYGCCVLALNGHQPKLPAGWSGGDRLAIHGSPTPTWGEAVSNGCLHAPEADLRYLMKTVPLGTTVRVHA